MTAINNIYNTCLDKLDSSYFFLFQDGLEKLQGVIRSDDRTYKFLMHHLAGSKLVNFHFHCHLCYFFFLSALSPSKCRSHVWKPLRYCDTTLNIGPVLDRCTSQ